MKRKIKKFNEGGFTELTVDPGYGISGQGSRGIGGGLSGLQQSASDIGAGALQVESGLRTIRSGSGGGGLGASGSPAGSSGLYKSLLGIQNPDNYRLQMQAQEQARARTFKKGGMVKAKSKTVKSTASKRGDGIATKGKTRGRMV